MSTTAPSHARSSSLYEGQEGLDVDWLLHSKKDLSPHPNHPQSRQDGYPGHQTSQAQSGTGTDGVAQNITPPAQAHLTHSSRLNNVPHADLPNGAANGAGHLSPAQRLEVPRKSSTEESRNDKRNPAGTLKKESRRSSWISNLSHKLSGATNSKTDTQSASKSPKLESSTTAPADGKANKNQENSTSQHVDEPPVVVPTSPRRPSVLVAAGTETKVDSPGFLGALRRLSSGNAASMGKGAGTGAACPRRVMNVDHHRERVKIPDLDQNKLKRVAFCVDVEIAGTAAHSDEIITQVGPAGPLPRSHESPTTEMPDQKKDAKSAKYKDMGEGAALKNPQNASHEKDQLGKTQEDITDENKEERNTEKSVNEVFENTESKMEDPAASSTTRKKEKKKRSEAERKERKERKRRHAEQNGLVPLELTRDQYESDTTSSNTTPGAHTPRKHSDQPTTDPLRIYKRCCQLRETTALAAIKDQIVQPAATLAEAPGTVAVINLTGTSMALQDVVTFGDWLAVVPVRKLILEDCNLTDESLRVILAGLLSCKTTTQARYNRKLNQRSSGKPAKEQMGFIEKLCLKNNSNITSAGWKHMALFMHMSRSLVGIDLTGIPYPNSSAVPSHVDTPNGVASNSNLAKADNMSALVSRAIGDRLGDKLQELLLTNCNLSASSVADLVDAAIKCKLRRLGLAANSLNKDGLGHIVRYVTSGLCEGLDLGSNDLHNTGQFLSEALDESNPLFALSVSNCNLEPEDLSTILPRFTTLQNFKFIDLSRNRGLFNGSKNAIPLFRKYIPKMPALKRLHLADVDLQPDHVIALAEMFPDCPSLCHVSMLENDCLVGAMNSKSAEEQEEAAAFLAALMTAVRVSQTIVAIEIEVPSAETSEVVRALASQIVAYSLRNMERSALTDIGVEGPPSAPLPHKDAPEVLLHLVGHMEGYSENHDRDEPAPDEDYVIASTGIAKALGVCLRNQGVSRMGSRNISPSASGTATPRNGGMNVDRAGVPHKPKDVGFELCEAARKIRMRLRPALVKEDRAGNMENYHRLAMLDVTLQRMIQRFEDEYPDARPEIPEVETPEAATSPPESPDISRVNSMSEGRNTDGSLNRIHDSDHSITLSRTPSNTSLAARALTSEEGRMHRFGQSMRRELLRPTGTDDFAHGTTVHDPPEPEHFAGLRKKLEKLEGEEIRRRVEELGADRVLKQLGLTADELRAYRHDDPEGYAMFRESHMAANSNQALA